MASRIPGRMNLTLAAYYERKPSQLAEFIEWCQTSIANRLSAVFQPYEIGQVHATLIGLEGKRRDGKIYHTNYAKLGSDKKMDLEGLLDFLDRTSLLPLRVRIGGFRLSDRYPFTSLDRHPYWRSFSIQASNKVVAIGWSENEGKFPDTLDRLRRYCNRYHVLHKYHQTSQDIDNDLFFVLGTVKPNIVTKEICEAVSEEIRTKMAEIEPLYLDLDRENLSLVAYLDEKLPLATSVSISLKDAREDIEAIKRLYAEVV